MNPQQVTSFGSTESMIVLAVALGIVMFFLWRVTKQRQEKAVYEVEDREGMLCHHVTGLREAERGAVHTVRTANPYGPRGSVTIWQIRTDENGIEDRHLVATYDGEFHRHDTLVVT